MACRVLLGVVFAVSAATKLMAPRPFARSLRRMGVLPGRLVRIVVPVVIGTETLIVLLLAAPLTASASIAFVVAAGLLVTFTLAIVVSVRRGHQEPCRCFGRSTVPLGTRHVVRNMMLLAVAIVGFGGSVAGGGASPGVLVVAAVAGLVLGGLATVYDDIVGLFLPAPEIRP